MAEKTFGDFFVSDVEDEPIADVDVASPPVVPAAAPPPASAGLPQWSAAPVPVEPAPIHIPTEPVLPSIQQPGPAPALTTTGADTPSEPMQAAALSPAAATPEEELVAQAPVATEPSEHASVEPVPDSREARLARALDTLMQENHEIQATALVSLDGFTMASALPDGMHEDRVGAMSAAILGLGERAATELGRGSLSQVFIEGADGYVVLLAAGERAVLTALADSEAKLGLVLYDMRDAADEIADILG